MIHHFWSPKEMPMTSMHKKNANERGLTIIEIMVVLIILGVLVGFLGQKLFGAGDKAKANITKLSLQQTKSFINEFQLQYNTLPTSLEELTRCTERTGPGCIPITTKDTLVDGWGNPLVYETEGNNRTYRIKSLGADGREGGEGVDFDFYETGP